MKLTLINAHTEPLLLVVVFRYTNKMHSRYPAHFFFSFFFFKHNYVVIAKRNVTKSNPRPHPNLSSECCQVCSGESFECAIRFFLVQHGLCAILVCNIPRPAPYPPLPPSNLGFNFQHSSCHLFFWPSLFVKAKKKNDHTKSVSIYQQQCYY